MPFVSKDWRSPGELWVRYDGGWELKKTLLSIHARWIVKNEDKNEKSVSKTSIPSFPVIIKSTREKAGFNCLSEALLRLDFASAIQDTRRFAYASHILHCLCARDRLIQLSVASQKILFNVIEIMAHEISMKRQNEHVLKQILHELHNTLSIRHVFGGHQGSRDLLQQHQQHRLRIEQTLNSTKGEDNNNDECNESLIKWLPEECVREVLLRLSNARDIESVENVCTLMERLAGERRLWRELVQSHFTNEQIECVQNEREELRENWRQLYWALRRRFGLKLSFVETIMLCRRCSCLFWDSLGHRCIVVDEDNSDSDSNDEDDNNKGLRVPIMPDVFLSFFSI